MARKKKNNYEDFGDWQDADHAEPAADVEGPKVNLEDFMIMEKVEAFLAAYRPAGTQTMQTEEFDDARLREFFKAYVCPLGDPLKIYVRTLATHGFQMQTSIVSGQPVILADPVY